MSSAGLCGLWPPILSVILCMLNFPGHLEPLFSISWSPAFGGGGRKGEHGKMLRHCSSGHAGKRGTGALAPGNTSGSRCPGTNSPERHGWTQEELDLSVTRGTWVQTHRKSGFVSSAHRRKNCFQNVELMCFRRCCLVQQLNRHVQVCWDTAVGKARFTWEKYQKLH